MFFHASKLFWFFAAPTNALVLLALLGALLLFTRFARPARWLVLFSCAGLLFAAMSPLPYWLMRPLEDRFPKVTMTGPVDGIIVLGGAIGTARGMTSMNDAAERLTDSAALALKYPGARLVFTGGDGSLLSNTPDGEAKTEADAARLFYMSLGIPASQIIIEDRSRNTRENAIFTKPLLDQKPGQRWLLITSAWHMPRSVGIFRRTGIDVIPYPVDFATRGIARDYRQLNRGFSHGLSLTDLAVKEWIGLVVYRLAGYTDSLLPGP
ncbi:MAG: YdcF family protein [Bosea sp. (in: a-proteobacteria)]